VQRRLAVRDDRLGASTLRGPAARLDGERSLFAGSRPRARCDGELVMREMGQRL
jgi:hypothetical protein